MTTLTQTQLDFRQAMSNLAAAVNIVTTDGPHGKLGITVSAVCSFTDDPPTLIVCVNRSSAAHDVFAANGTVAINVLSSDQEELARHFSGATKVPMEERFAWDIWEEGTNAPVLKDARVAIVGNVKTMLTRGTHSAMFVEVESVRTRDGSGGLVYDNRTFHPVKVDQTLGA
jgi:flavin reductase (NADH)